MNIVLEVLSRSTARRDRTEKLAGYFKVAGIEHYLLVNPEEREVIWYRRAAGGGSLEPPFTVRDGALRLDPPGVELQVADIFPPE